MHDLDLDGRVERLSAAMRFERRGNAGLRLEFFERRDNGRVKVRLSHLGTKMHQQFTHMVVALLHPLAQLSGGLHGLVAMALAQRVLQ